MTYYQPPQQQWQPQQSQRKKSSTGRTVAIVLGSVFGGVLVLCVGLTVLAAVLPDPEDGDASPKANASAAAESATEPAEEPDEGDVEDLTIEVIDVYNETNTLGDAFTTVEVKVTNNTDDRVYVGPMDWYVVDSDDNRYDAAFGPASGRNDRLQGLHLGPGQSTKGTFSVDNEVDVAVVAYQRWAFDSAVEVEVT